MAQGDRGVRRGRERLSDAGLVPGGPLRVAVDDASVVRLRVRCACIDRDSGEACWLAGLLWRELQLDWTTKGGALAGEPEANALGPAFCSSGRLQAD